MKFPFIDKYKSWQTRRKWRSQNGHNTTQISCDVPPGIVTVGKGTYGFLNVHYFTEESGEKLVIGNYVSIASDVNFVLGGNHQINHISTFPLRSVFFNEKCERDCQSNGPIIIEDEVWIGTGATILSGVTIGKGAIIAACSVVTKNVPAYAIYGGNPAKLIRYRLDEDVIAKIKHIALADFDDETIKKNIHLFYTKFDHNNVDEIVMKLENLRKKVT